MQGDIRLPKPKKRRPAHHTPKHIEHLPSPDITIDEAELDKPKEAAKSSRSLLIAPHKHFIRFWRWWLTLSKNERFAIIAAALLVFGAGAVGWFAFIRPDSSPSISVTQHPKKKVPITVASPLTGLQVDPALAGRPVTGIMIENSVFARPQSGLQAAGVVYEAIAEGGITRFMALFQDSTPQYIGPVRSHRTPSVRSAAAPIAI
jgi:hypothetical protein